MNPSKSPTEHVIDIALGYILSRSLHVATELGIADLLHDGAPKTIEELSSTTGAHPKSLYRLLRTLAGQGILFTFYLCSKNKVEYEHRILTGIVAYAFIEDAKYTQIKVG